MSEAHTARAHAKLAPSSAKRWVECSGSIVMSEGIPNKSSVFAAEGSAAHELCAHCLETGAAPADYLDKWVDLEAKDVATRFVDADEAPGEEENRYFRVDEEMVDGVEEYVNYVRSLMVNEDCLLTVEERLDMTHIDPRIFGTGDATVLDMRAKHLHVIDFKYGKGVAVEANKNPQLLLYAAGAARRHHNHDIARLTVTVVQPRAYHFAGGIRDFDLDLIELMEFEFEIETAAKRVNEATESHGVLPDKEWADTYLAADNDWCRFCLAQPICPKRREQVIADAIAEFDDVGDLVLMEPTEMSHDQLAQVLRNADSLQNYVKSVQQHAHALAMNGTKLPGLKLVAKRATRRWKDEDAAQEVLAVLGVSKDEMFDAPKFKTPAKLESLFPGKNKTERQNAMAELIEKKSSGCNLVPADDPRPEVVVGAASEFEEVDVG